MVIYYSSGTEESVLSFTKSFNMVIFIGTDKYISYITYNKFNFRQKKIIINMVFRKQENYYMNNVMMNKKY